MGIITIYNLQTDELFLARDSEPAIYVDAGFAGHIYIRLAITRQEKIVRLKGVNGYNPFMDFMDTIP